MDLRLIIILVFLSLTSSQLLTSNWSITPYNESSAWQKRGLNITQGLCSMKLKQLYQNIEVMLYEDNQYNNYMFMTVYLNFSISKDFPYYEGKAHLQYMKNVEMFSLKQKKEASIANILFENNTLTIVQDNSTLSISYESQNINPYMYFFAIAHAFLKILLLVRIVSDYKRDNTKLSFSLVYTFIGWELQAHLLVTRVFEASDDPGDAFFGVFIGMLGWGFTLASIFFLPNSELRWQQCEGLSIYLYECSGGFLLPQEINIFLYSISPLLQIRFNSLKNIKNGMCIQAFLMYFINIFFLLYLKGCPACLLRFPLNINLCVLIVIMGILMSLLLYFQQRNGPYLCLREVINGKDFNYFEEINLSENDEIAEEACPICLQSLGEELFVENVRMKQNGVKTGMIIKTPCGHRYHPGCMRKWLLQKNTCPLDNQQIPPLYQ